MIFLSVVHPFSDLNAKVATNTNDEDKTMTENRYELNKNLAQMLKGGVAARSKSRTGSYCRGC